MALRRHLVIWLAGLGLARGAAAIRTYPLDERCAYVIHVSREEPTTCVFPKNPAAMEGAGIGTRLEDSPAVLLSHEPGARYFSVRALKDNATAAVNVVVEGKIYALSFISGGDVDRVVTFFDALAPAHNANDNTARALTERVRLEEQYMSDHPAVTTAIPSIEPATVTTYPHFSVTIEKIWRFEAEDTLVFRLGFQNSGETLVRYDCEQLGIRTGAEIYPVSFTDASGVVPPNAQTRVYLAIAGTPEGGRANLSLRATFSVLVPLV